MNSRSNPTGPRKSGTRTRKPATIDLEAKNVDAKPDAKKETASKVDSAKPDVKKTETPAKPLGRAGAKQTTDSSKPKSEPVKTEAAASSPEGNSSQTSSSAKSGGGFFAGLVGAAAAIVGLGAIGQFDASKNLPLIGALYSDNSEQVVGGENSAKIADLAKDIEALKSASPQVDLTPINERLEKIETDNAGGVSVDRLLAVETSLAEVTEILASIAIAAESGETAGSGEIAAAITSVTQRLDKLESSVSQLLSNGSGPSEETSRKLEAIESRLSDLSASQGADLTPVENKIGEIERSIAGLVDKVDANAKGVDGLNAQSSTLQETVASVKASEKVARSVAVGALGAALENDDPISLAVASIESLGGKSAETERLLVLAKEGIPTRKLLLEGLQQFTDSVQNPLADTNSGGISERFWANAKNLVSFRSSGPQEGSSAIAILSRVKANLENDDLAGVVSEWEQLPQEMQGAGADWIAKVNMRLEAFALFNTLSNNLSALDG